MTNRPDQIIATVEDADITYFDLETLNDGNWINDMVIQFHGRILEKTAKEAGKEIKFIAPCTTQFIRFYPDEFVESAVQAIEPEKYAFVFIPITNGTSLTSRGGHWSLICWIPGRKVEKERFLHLDSINHYNEKTAIQVVNRFMQLMKISDYSFEKPKLPNQQNSYDCGAYLMAFEEYIVDHNCDLSHIENDLTPEYMTSFRSNLIQKIVGYAK